MDCLSAIEKATAHIKRPAGMNVMLVPSTQEAVLVIREVNRFKREYCKKAE